MSHAATNWAIQQRGLKPAAKIVLWHLADCHNGHTGQCNPRQAILADRCEMSRSTVNVHLAELARRGLIRRVSGINPATKRQRPTLYVLEMDDPQKAVSGNWTRTQDVGLHAQDIVVPSPDSGHGTEPEKLPKPCPDSGHGAVSGKLQKPCPDFSQSRVRNPDSIENPGIEPGIEPCVDPEAKNPIFKLDDDFTDRFIKAFPRTGNMDLTVEELRKALKGGVDPDLLIQAANAYRHEQAGNKRQYVAYSENWLAREGWKKHQPTKPVDRAEINEATAKLIRTGKRHLCGFITAATARDLVDQKLVTLDQCQTAGVI